MVTVCKGWNANGSIPARPRLYDCLLPPLTKRRPCQVKIPGTCPTLLSPAAWQGRTASALKSGVNFLRFLFAMGDSCGAPAEVALHRPIGAQPYPIRLVNWFMSK